MSLADMLRDEARRSGIDAVAFASAEPFEGRGIAASRLDPGRLLPGAQSIVVAAKYIGGAVQEGADATTARLGRLTLSGFFSDIVRPLEVMAAILTEAGYGAIVCDSGPGDRSVLPLKLAAVRAGLGWQGKNTLLMNRQYGSFLALGGIVTTAPLPHGDASAEAGPRSRCGTCTLCIRSCPLGALEPYHLRRSRCLTHRLGEPGILSARTIRAMENRLFDCDRCQEVCPHNHAHIGGQSSGGPPAALIQNPLELLELARMTPDQYEQFREKLALPHPFPIFRRNTIAALANSGLREAPELLKAASGDDDVGVAGTARNALRVLGWRAAGVT